VIGIPLGLIFGYQIVLQVAPALQNVMPYWLVNPLGQPQTSLAAAVLTGQPLPSVTPIIGSAVGVVIFIVIALWRFRREEF
jgi:tellurite resistance protein TehA-like permease